MAGERGGYSGCTQAHAFRTLELSLRLSIVLRRSNRSRNSFLSDPAASGSQRICMEKARGQGGVCIRQRDTGGGRVRARLLALLSCR
jgi:hypothetical protein